MEANEGLQRRGALPSPSPLPGGCYGRCEMARLADEAPTMPASGDEVAALRSQWRRDVPRKFCSWAHMAQFP